MIGQRVQSEGIAYEMVGKAADSPSRFASPTTRRRDPRQHRRQQPDRGEPSGARPFVRQIRARTKQRHPRRAAERRHSAILTAATDPSLPQRDLNRALRAIGDVLGRPDSFAYDYAGNDQETIVSRKSHRRSRRFTATTVWLSPPPPGPAPTNHSSSTSATRVTSPRAFAASG